MTKRYPKTLSRGANNTVIALSETEVAKLFLEDTRSDIGSEAEKMQYANEINGLIVKFIRLDVDEAMDADMLVMERLYPLDFRAYELEYREAMLEHFEREVGELYEAGFVHRGLYRSSNMSGMCFDNIILTEHGIRLIDVGPSTLRMQVGDRLFDRFFEREIEALERFRQFWLRR